MNCLEYIYIDTVCTVVLTKWYLSRLHKYYVQSHSTRYRTQWFITQIPVIILQVSLHSVGPIVRSTMTSNRSMFDMRVCLDSLPSSNTCTEPIISPRSYSSRPLVQVLCRGICVHVCMNVCMYVVILLLLFLLVPDPGARPDNLYNPRPGLFSAPSISYTYSTPYIYGYPPITITE